MWKQGVYRSEGRKEQTKKNGKGVRVSVCILGFGGGGGIIY